MNAPVFKQDRYGRMMITLLTIRSTKKKKKSELSAKYAAINEYINNNNFVQSTNKISIYA